MSKQSETSGFAAYLSERIGVSAPAAIKIRAAVDQIIEGVFAMSSGFCLDEPDERAALADMLAVDICDALPALAALLGKGK